MTPETRIALVCLAFLGVGLALVVIGLGGTTKMAALGAGVLVSIIAMRVLALVWK